MNWNSQMEVQYQNHSTPYDSIGSFVDFIGGLTFDHVNYIFADTNYLQGNAYPAMNTSLYKFAASEPESFSYYEYGHGYVVHNLIPITDEHSGHSGNPSIVADDQEAVLHVHQEGNSSSMVHAGPWNHQDARDYEVVWQDSVDPDSMTYEELLELGEVVGTQNRGLSQDQIALLPTSKFRRGLFSRKRFRGERCVICQMEYKRGDSQITLPCKHVYHTGCGSRWLSINKACPICYKDVSFNIPKH